MHLRATGIVIACALLAPFPAAFQSPPTHADNFPPPRAERGRVGADNFPRPFAVEDRVGVLVGAVAAERAIPAPSAPQPAAPPQQKVRSLPAIAAPSPHHAMTAPRAGGVVTIPVPLYKQTMNLDCETASLQMALAYRGHWYSQSYMFQFERADTRPALKSADGTILQWGNPFNNFVGNVNGHEFDGTGYGVYYPPILWIANGLGDPSAVGGSGYSASTIYQALASGHPVQVWIEYQWVLAWNGVWKAWDNTKVHYSLREHNVVLSGVSDTQVRVNDPWPGTQYWIDKSTFERSWADFYNMAIIY